MTKTQRDSIIAVIMVALFAGAAFRTFYLSKKSRPVDAAAAAPLTTSVETQLLEDAQFIGSVRVSQQTAIDQAGRWEQDWERDPFRAEEMASAGGIENLILKGVLWDDEHPKAIINDKVLRLGEAIDGYKIMKIKPSSVVLWTGEKDLELSVFRSPFLPSEPVLETGTADSADQAPAGAPKELPQNQSSFPPINELGETSKSLQAVKAFVTDTSGADRMMQLMQASSPGAANDDSGEKNP